MKTALGLMGLAGFPYQFSSIIKNSVANTSRKFHSPGRRTKPKKIFNDDMKISVTPGNHFVTKFWDILKETRLKHTSAAESKRWLSGHTWNIGHNNSTLPFSAPPRDVKFHAKSLTVVYFFHSK